MPHGRPCKGGMMSDKKAFRFATPVSRPITRSEQRWSAKPFVRAVLRAALVQRSTLVSPESSAWQVTPAPLVTSGHPSVFACSACTAAHLHEPREHPVSAFFTGPALQVTTVPPANVWPSLLKLS